MIPTESVVKYACIAGKAVNGRDMIAKAHMTNYPTHGFSDLLAMLMAHTVAPSMHPRIPSVPQPAPNVSKRWVSCKWMD